MIVAFPSNSAETYCYTFYEGLFLSETAVPVVGPFGHPASVIEENGIGVVMTDTSADALVASCIDAARRWDELWQNRNAWRRKVQSSVLDYLTAYRSSGGMPKARQAEPLEVMRLRVEQLQRIRNATHPSRRALSAAWREGTQHPPMAAPLRHQLVDQVNDLIKSRLPGVHHLGKRLASLGQSR